MAMKAAKAAPTIACHSVVETDHFLLEQDKQTRIASPFLALFAPGVTWNVLVFGDDLLFPDQLPIPVIAQAFAHQQADGIDQ